MRMTVNPRKLSSGVALCAGLALCLAGSASAQPMFQSTFPGGGSNDAARGGVLLTSDGGTISVGESQSFGTGAYDVYVVKTDECGSLQWATTYDFGGNDYGRKIRQTSDGGYIIVGTTYRATCCDDEASIKALDSDIFLLSINSKGGVQWAKTYGGASNDEGTDVQSYLGDGYVVSGNTQSFGDGKINGYLMRTDLNGDIIWGRSYGQSEETGVDILNSCTVTAKGDILATGSTNLVGSEYVLVIRTDGNGKMPPGWANVYPGQAASAGRHIIETTDGTFVIGGWITLKDMQTRDGYLLRIKDDGTPVLDRVLVNAKFDDEIAEVRQGFDKDILITGYLTNAPGGFGGRDLLLGRVGYKFDPVILSVHGGKRDDEGYSIAVDLERSKKYGQLYVAANGVTRSFTKASDEDLYLVQAIDAVKSGCNDAIPEVKDFALDPVNKPFTYCHPKVMVQCVARVAVEYNEKQNLLCTSCKFDEQLQKNSDDPTLGEAGHDIQSNGLDNGATHVSLAAARGQAGTMQNAR